MNYSKLTKILILLFIVLFSTQSESQTRRISVTKYNVKKSSDRNVILAYSGHFSARVKTGNRRVGWEQIFGDETKKRRGSRYNYTDFKNLWDDHLFRQKIRKDKNGSEDFYNVTKKSMVLEYKIASTHTYPTNGKFYVCADLDGDGRFETCYLLQVSPNSYYDSNRVAYKIKSYIIGYAKTNNGQHITPYLASKAGLR